VVGDTPFLNTKRAAANYFIAAIVPEAIGLASAAEMGAAILYEVAAEDLA
jgi:hypothetical protein